MNILGLNLFSHDTAAALVREGKLVSALEQERLCGEKHTKRLPLEAARHLLAAEGLTPAHLDMIAVGWDFVRFVNELYVRPAVDDPGVRRFLLRDLAKLRDFLAAEALLRQAFDFAGPIRFYRHHDAHAEFAFRAAGREAAATLVLDGYGDFQTCSLYETTGDRHRRLAWQRAFPHSLGLAYSAVTHYLGFKPHCDEGIVMGLASHGDPHAATSDGSSHLKRFREALPDAGDAIFACNPDYLSVGHWRDRWVTAHFIEVFGPRREPGGPLLPAHMHVAAALQRRLEEIVINLCRMARARVAAPHLAIGGGVALNCVMNSALLRAGVYDSVSPPPSPGDGGVAVGAALLGHVEATGRLAALPDNLVGLGPVYPDEAIERAVWASGLPFRRLEDLAGEVAASLARGRIVGWFQGRSEFGPRALGQRSILAAPFPAGMKDVLNARVKFREHFRPFAPVVPEDRAGEFFETLCPTPYMMHAFQVKADMAKRIPAVVHVDGSCRVQTITHARNPRLHDLLLAFEMVSGVPVLLNTSFNVKGQPIVETPENALASFARMHLDELVIGPWLVGKST